MSLWLPLIFLIFASNQGRPFLFMFCPSFIFWFRKILYTKKTQSHFGCHCESLWVLCCNYSNWIWVLSIPFVFCSALAVPSGLWYLIFAPGQPGNLSFFIKSICWAPWISQFQSTELPSIFHKAQPCVLRTVFEIWIDWILQAFKKTSLAIVYLRQKWVTCGARGLFKVCSLLLFYF